MPNLLNVRHPRELKDEEEPRIGNGVKFAGMQGKSIYWTRQIRNTVAECALKKIGKQS